MKPGLPHTPGLPEGAIESRRHIQTPFQAEHGLGGVSISEPGTLLLLGSGIVGMGTMARRRNRRK